MSTPRPLSWKPWAAAAATGLLLGLAQPKVDAWPLAWVAWVPLIFAVRGRAPRDVFKLAFAAHYVAFVVILYWIEVVVRVFGGVPFVVTWIPLALLAAYVAAWPALAFWGARKLEERRPAAGMLWTLPVFVTASEWVRGKLFTGFPWGHPAYSQYKFTSLIQIADVVGIDGVLFLLVSASVGLVALADFARTRRGLRPPLAALALMAAAMAYGHWRLSDVRRQLAGEGATIKIGLAQGNIDQSLKWNRSFRDNTLAIYDKLTRSAAAQGAELVFWPETAAPFYFEPKYDEEDSAKVVKLAQETGTYIFFGAPAAGYRAGKARSFNRGYLLDRQGGEIASYDKSHLVPFSEYIPLPMVFGWIENLVPVVGNFAMGEKRRALAVPGLKFGPLICYESIFPAEVREFVADGAQMLTIITNDAWFLRTSATYQHISMAAVRAVETRVPVVQAGNTGVTAVLRPDGTIQRDLPVFETAVLIDDVKLVKINSFFVRYGEVFAYATLLVTAALLVWGLRAPATEAAKEPATVKTKG